jgi:hypothetical protein
MNCLRTFKNKQAEAGSWCGLSKVEIGRGQVTRAGLNLAPAQGVFAVPGAFPQEVSGDESVGSYVKYGVKYGAAAWQYDKDLGSPFM